MDYNFHVTKHPLFGEEWLKAHQDDISWDDYYNQKLEISTDRGQVTVPARLTVKKDIRHLIKSI